MTVRKDVICSAKTLPLETGMSVQRDKTLPAAVLVPSSAFSSFLTFSIARIESGMPGRELGGKASKWGRKKALCELRPTKSLEKGMDSKKNKLSDVEWNKNRIFLCIKTWKVRHVLFAVCLSLDECR